MPFKSAQPTKKGAQKVEWVNKSRKGGKEKMIVVKAKPNEASSNKPRAKRPRTGNNQQDNEYTPIDMNKPYEVNLNENIFSKGRKSLVSISNGYLPSDILVPLLSSAGASSSLSGAGNPSASGNIRRTRSSSLAPAPESAGVDVAHIKALLDVAIQKVEHDYAVVDTLVTNLRDKMDLSQYQLQQYAIIYNMHRDGKNVALPEDMDGYAALQKINSDIYEAFKDNWERMVPINTAADIRLLSNKCIPTPPPYHTPTGPYQAPDNLSLDDDYYAVREPSNGRTSGSDKHSGSSSEEEYSDDESGEAIPVYNEDVIGYLTSSGLLGSTTDEDEDSN